MSIRPAPVVPGLVERALLGASVLVACALPAAASACPDCPVAQAVRASLFDQRFWEFLAVLLTPLAIVCAMAGLAYRVGRPPRLSARGTSK
jgi:hypothetical protein